MLKKFIKNLTYKLVGKNIKDLYEIIDSYQYISFDIFDTLIKRNVKNPYDVFKLIEQKYNVENFVEKRTEAEKKVRKSSKLEEVTLDEIYKELDYSEKLKEELYNLEINVEKTYCVANTEFLKIYNYLLKQKKKIFLTSDMYLPKDVIEDILKNNGYKNYIKLYLSSEYKLTKSSGNLYKFILKDQNISGQNLIHIGDSLKGDYLNPKKVKIKSILIEKSVNNCLFCSKTNKSLDYNILFSFINNHIQKEWNEYEAFGYEILGPILYSFTTWLHKKIKEDKIEKIYFLARDAKLIMEVYKKRFKENIPIYYIYTSRKSSVLANINDLDNYDDFINRTKSLYTKVSTVKDLLHLFDINISLPFQMKNIKNLTDKEKKEIFDFIKNNIEDTSQIQHDYLKRYLDQNDFKGNIAIVDIGWNGTIQYNLQKFIKNNKTKLFGYYYGIFYSNEYDEYDILNKNGFLFNKNNLEYQSIISLSIGLFELLFLSTDATTKSYQEHNNLIVPKLGEKANIDNDLQNVIKIQEMAKKFVNDVQNCHFTSELDKLSKEAFFQNYCSIVLNPKLKIIKMFEKIKFQNIYIKKLIDHKSLFFYIIHPSKFYKDFRDSTCRIMFMKSIFKVPFPYYQILKKLYVKSRD